MMKMPADTECHPEWSTIPSHRRHVFVCNGPRCAQRGAACLWKLLSEQLVQQGLLESETGVLLTRTHCQYPCNLGPVMTVYPDDCWYRVTTPEDVQRLVAEHFRNNMPVQDLLLKPGTNRKDDNEN